MKEHDYKYWKTFFDHEIKKYGDGDIHGIASWDDVTHIKYWEFISTIIGHVTDKKILDVGGGNSNYNALTKSNLVINIDIAEEQLRYAIKHNTLPMVGNAVILPFKNQSFDYVLCIGVFQCIMLNDRIKLMNELHRVCKPGGLLFIETPNKAALVRKLLRLKYVITNLSMPTLSNLNYVSLQEFVNFIKKLNYLYEIYVIFLIYRPLDFVSFTTKITNFRKNDWFVTDFVFVLRRRY